MIWYDKMLDFLDGQPDGYTVQLIGKWSTPGSGPLITLRIIIEGDDDPIITTVFSHNPAMMRHEEPTTDDILAKYNHKVVKICNKVQKMNFEALLDKVRNNKF